MRPGRWPPETFPRPFDLPRPAGWCCAFARELNRPYLSLLPLNKKNPASFFFFGGTSYYGPKLPTPPKARPQHSWLGGGAGILYYCLLPEPAKQLLVPSKDRSGRFRIGSVFTKGAFLELRTPRSNAGPSTSAGFLHGQKIHAVGHDDLEEMDGSSRQDPVPKGIFRTSTQVRCQRLSKMDLYSFEPCPKRSDR